jgi:hypothetical protein
MIEIPPRTPHLVTSVLKSLSCCQACHASSHYNHTLGQWGGVESILGCDEEGLIIWVLEALGQVLIVGKAVGGSQQKSQDQNSCGQKKQ